jgi:hypothetical protein
LQRRGHIKKRRDFSIISDIKQSKSVAGCAGAVDGAYHDGGRGNFMTKVPRIANRGYPGGCLHQRHIFEGKAA